MILPQVSESLSIDAIIDNALVLCRQLPESPEYLMHSRNIRDLRERLAGGRLRIAVLGQFNRGKSTFVNALLGMHILPTSVLPITSVPTVILTGEKNRCVISFSDSKEDAVVEDEAEAICAHLATYVTEDQNPKNRLCVSDAVVKCKSQLLAHGTVLIDTPGFGSTHTHNTETTLDLLASCDAALFLLSADLPITQVEVDFLHQVIATVPRLFFVYNKVDLINQTEREVSERFIRDTLIKNFGLTFDIRLFPVSAKMMNLKNKKSDAFTKSGLAAIEKEIIDFLLREKYFTLSEALTQKFKDALDQIIISLEKGRDRILLPINDIEEKCKEIEQLENNSNQERKKALSLSEVEETALYDYCDTLANKKREDLQSEVTNRLSHLIRSVSGNRPDAIISAALTQLLEETFSRLYIYFVSELNKPLRNAAAAHIRELKKLAKNIITELDIAIEVEQFQSRLELVEIDLAALWKPDTSFDLFPPKATLFGLFSTQDKQQRLLIEHYSSQLQSLIDAGLIELIEKVNHLVASIFDMFVVELKKDYGMLLQLVKERREETALVFEDAQKKSEPELSNLISLIQGFTEVKEMVI